jgi:hypothetical protein
MLLLPMLIALGLAMPAKAFGLDPASLTPVELRNGTNQEIHTLFLSPEDSDYWGPDLLGETGPVRRGEVRTIRVDLLPPCSKFDILALSGDNAAYIRWDHTVCVGIREVVDISPIDKVRTAPRFDFLTLSIRNQTRYPMMHLFLSPADSRMWGLDLLQERERLRQNGQMHLLIPTAATEVGFDLLTVDEDGAHYRFAVEIDMSGSATSYAVVIEPDDYIAEEYAKK